MIPLEIVTLGCTIILLLCVLWLLLGIVNIINRAERSTRLLQEALNQQMRHMSDAINDMSRELEELRREQERR